MARVINPTLILGLGDFGRQALSLIQRELRHQEEGDRCNLAFLDLSPFAPEGEEAEPGGPDRLGERHWALELPSPLDPGGTERLEGLIQEACTELLRFSHFLRYFPRFDSRPPWLDVYLVADLGDPLTRPLVVDLVATVARKVLTSFSNIFVAQKSGFLNFVVCPLLALRGVRHGPQEADVVALLRRLTKLSPPHGAVSTDPVLARRPLSRVFLLEEQTSKYILSPEEMVSTVGSFLSFLIFSNLRQEEPIQAFMQGEGIFMEGGRALSAIFSSFACATLEIPVPALRRYCLSRAALELIDRLRLPEEISIEEREASTRDMVLSRGTLMERLGERSSGGELEQYIERERPHFAFPAIEADHAPEDIENGEGGMYGRGWVQGQEELVRRFAEEVEDHRMGDLAEGVDRNGLALSREVTEAIRRGVDGWVWSGARGWVNARERMEEVQARGAKVLKRLEEELQGKELPPFPSFKPFDRAHQAFRDQVARRPRQGRLRFFAPLVAALAALLLSFVPRYLYVTLFTREVTPLVDVWKNPSTTPIAHQALDIILDPRAAFVWLSLIIYAVVALSLRGYRRNREEDLQQSLDAMRNALDSLIHGTTNSVRHFFTERLRLSTLLWATRVARRVVEQSQEELDRLNVIKLGLDQLALAFREELKGLGLSVKEGRVERTAQPGLRGDLVYRMVMAPDMLDALYQRFRQPPAEMADELFERIREEGPLEWRDLPPFAERERIEAYLGGLFDGVGTELLFGPVPEAGAAKKAVEGDLQGMEVAIRSALREAMEEFLGDLTTKLSAGLERVGGEERGVKEDLLMVIAHERLVPYIEASFKRLGELAHHGEGSLKAEYRLIDSSHDMERLHLALVQTRITLESMAMAQGERAREPQGVET